MLVELRLVEQRHQAVLEVLAGVTVTDVALRYGVTRQTVQRWLRRSGCYLPYLPCPDGRWRARSGSSGRADLAGGRDQELRQDAGYAKQIKYHDQFESNES